MQSPGEINEITLAGKKIRLLETHDPEKLFDELLALDDDHPHITDERIPYWAELWPSAIALATHILRGKSLAGYEVLEIGCGLGLPGIAAGLQGAEVTFADYMEEALSCARENWKLNLERPATFRQMDWRKPMQDVQSKFLLASDVAYEQRSFGPLVEFFKHTVLPGGTILLSEPGRKYAQPLFDALAAAGFRKEAFVYPVEQKGIRSNINVLELFAPSGRVF